MIHTVKQPDLFTIERTPRMPTDVCSGRHRGADTSIEANKRVQKESDRAKVLERIKARGNATLKEIAADLGKQVNQVSGRCSELLALKQICYFKDERRDGCRVYWPR